MFLHVNILYDKKSGLENTELSWKDTLVQLTLARIIFYI